MRKNKPRLDTLADGIFAIVMTILVFEIKVPEIFQPSNHEIFELLIKSYPLFLSYLLSFATLFTYWRGYHAVASDFAKTTNVTFENLSGAFLFFVALIPFSSHILGIYSKLQAGVIVFAVNVIIIGTTLFFMRTYAWKSKAMLNKKITNLEHRHAHMRILVPILFSVLAILVSYLNTEIALLILTVAIMFNLTKRSTKFAAEIIDASKAAEQMVIKPKG